MWLAGRQFKDWKWVACIQAAAVERKANPAEHGNN